MEFAKKRNPFNHPCVMYKKMAVEAAGSYKDFYLLEDYYFSNDRTGKQEAAAARESYAANKNLVIFARDSCSFREMEKEFPETHIELCPDIVFSLNGIVSVEKRSGIGVCMRDDKEKSITSEQTKVIIEQLFSDNAEIKNFDTIIDADKPIIGEYREKLVIGKLKEFADCETVVTDRLHGMIFSYITSTPCVWQRAFLCLLLLLCSFRG